MKIQNEFDMYIDKLKEIYQENPEKATKEAHDSLLRMGFFNKTTKSGKKRKILTSEEYDKLFLVISFAITALIGLFNLTTYPLYLFGILFFIAGILISTHVRGFGLIFLFSHGISGYGVMMGALLSSITDNPLLKDNPTNVVTYIGIIVVISVIAVIISSVFNLIGNDRVKKHLIILPLILYNIALFMAAILTKILPYVYNFKI